MKHWITRITATAALAAGMVFAQAPAPQPGTGAHRGGMIEHLANYLNLTADQKAQVQTIFQEARQSSQSLRDQLKQNRQALTDAVKNNKTDAIDSLSATQGTLTGQLTAIHTKAMAKVYALLTPEQKQKADQLQGMFQQRFQHRFGPQQ